MGCCPVRRRRVGGGCSLLSHSVSISTCCDPRVETEILTHRVTQCRGVRTKRDFKETDDGIVAKRFDESAFIV